MQVNDRNSSSPANPGKKPTTTWVELLEHNFLGSGSLTIQSIRRQYDYTKDRSLEKKERRHFRKQIAGELDAISYDKLIALRTVCDHLWLKEIVIQLLKQRDQVNRGSIGRG